MTRRKGEVTNRQRDKSHPFQVEIVVPDTGLGNAWDIMYRWVSQHDHVSKGGHRTMSWCFCRREVADAFVADFGGRRVDMPVDRRYLKIDQPDARELERRRQCATFGLHKMAGRREG